MKNPKVSEKKPKQPETKSKQFSAALPTEHDPVYRNIVENSFTGIFIMQDWKYIFVNNKFAEMHGYKPGEMIGMDYLSTIHPDDREKMKKYLVSRMGNMIPGSIKIVKRLTKSRRTIICETSGSTFTYQGRPAVMGNVQDITDSYLVEQRLKISEQKYKTLVENSLTGIYIQQDWKYVFVNSQYADMLGYDVAELIGKDYLATICMEDRDIVRQAIIQKFADTSREPKIIRRLRRDNMTIITQTVAGIIDFDGKRGIMGNVLDITRSYLSEQELKESEEKYRTLVENSIAGVFIMQDWKFVFVNNEFASILGYSPEEMIGLDYMVTIQPEARDNLRQTVAEGYAGKPFSPRREVIRVSKDGQLIMTELRATVIEYRGEPAVMGTIVDITDKYTTEQRLKESEEKYRKLTENSLVGIYIHQDDKYVFVNNVFARMHGYEPAELIGADYKITVHPDDLDYVRQRVAERLAGDTTVKRGVHKRLKKNGDVFYAQFLTTRIDFNGKPALMGNALDVTESKLVEERLQNSEQNFRNSIDSSQLGILIVTAELSEPKFLYGNQALLDIYGFSSIWELQATPAEQRFTPEAFKIYRERREKRLRGEALPEKYEASIIRKDGTVRHLQMFLKNVLWEGKKRNQLIHIDITERKKIEEDLKLKAELLNMATDSIILSDPKGTILYANDAACTLHGYTFDELTGMNILDLNVRNETLNTNIRKVWQKGDFTFETIHIKKDNTEIAVEVHAQIIEVGSKKLILSVDRDISERKRAQEQLIITDRLSTLGNLARGFSHELNNPLSAVIGYAQLLLLDKDITEKSRIDVENIIGQAQRIAGIIRNFSDFARGYAVANAPVNLNTIIKKVIDLRSYELTKKNITVITHFADNLPEIIVDVNQIQQVFLNLVLNADYFMGEANKQGSLIITTEYGAQIIRITIQDDGPGIEAEKLAHVFDPFYTTKDVGTGTGLGLTIAYRIITGHGGTLFADSKPGEGTTFTIELPVKE